ncbi:cardiolipin synthase (CMP-forming) [Arapaima gigas]
MCGTMLLALCRRHCGLQRGLRRLCALGPWPGLGRGHSCHTRGRAKGSSPTGRSAALPGPQLGPLSLSLCPFRVTSVRPAAPQGYRCYSGGSGQPNPERDGFVPPGDTKGQKSESDPGLSHFKELYENPWTIPNLLCIARMGLAPVLGYLIVEQYFHLSLGLFVLAGATDLLDGYIARNWANQKSALGSALDPLADKILISVLYVSLTYANLIPVPLTVLVISRDVALIAAVFYVRYKTVPPPRTLSKYFNPCYATAQLKPTLISKVNTAVQLVLVAASLAAPVFHYTDSAFLHALWLITTLTTAASGYSYYHYGKKTVEVLNRTK